MMKLDALTKIPKRSLNVNRLPQLRIAIPALSNRKYALKKRHSAARLERDDLLELFESDLSRMKSLKSKKAQHNVIQLRPYRVASITGLDRAA